jgi:hypothetical protein
MMAVRIRTGALLAVIVLATTACGQIFNPQNQTDQGVTTHADPSGDAGFSPTFDIIELRIFRGSAEIQVRIWTTPDPALPAPGTFPSGSQFSGGIGFNTDLNSGTGFASFVAPCGGQQGIDRFIDLTARNFDGTYTVRDAALAAIGTASVTQDGPRVTFTASFGVLGTPTGRTQVSAVVGVGTFVGRDCVPDAPQSLPSRSTGRTHPLIP